MKIRWLGPAVAGTFHNVDGGVAIGEVVDVDDAEAKRYIDLGQAEKASKKTETATPSDADVETAALDDEEEEPEDGTPKQSAPKQVWIDYAVDQGYDEAEVEAMTKAELIELF